MESGQVSCQQTKQGFVIGQLDDGSWTSQTERLLLMDSRDFNLVGIGLDDLIEVGKTRFLSAFLLSTSDRSEYNKSVFSGVKDFVCVFCIPV
jgi:hypothetical protein